MAVGVKAVPLSRDLFRVVESYSAARQVFMRGAGYPRDTVVHNNK